MLAKLGYNLSIQIYQRGIQIAALFHPKAKAWIKGRKGWLEVLTEKVEALPSGQPKVWVHCASLGEFEQGRPVIEALKTQKPELQIIVSFFSPSGYEIRKDYQQAALVCYLPTDTPKNARQFIEALSPDLAIFVKYEFWYHYLNQLQKNSIPTLLISALFRPEQLFFKSVGGFFRNMLDAFDHIFVQNHASARLLESIEKSHHSFGGDTRVDRVATIASAPKSFPEVASFVNHSKVLIGGSTWPPDEALLIPLINKVIPQHWKVILAPHETGKSAVQRLQKALEVPHVLYSELKNVNPENYKVLIIDNVGMLAHLYQYGDLAYIGGGFGAGIHNTLEPIAFGLPLFFGPKYSKFEEANFLIKQGGAFAVQSLDDLKQGFETWLDPNLHRQASRVALSYIQTNQGASKKITDYIEHNLTILK